MSPPAYVDAWQQPSTFHARQSSRMFHRNWRIVTTVDDLGEGLFGQVLLWTFELLPWLNARGLRPDWDVRSRLYGDAPDYRVIPGVFDLAYDLPSGKATVRDVQMLALRVRAVNVLGGDWARVHRLWARYFRVPGRIEALADAAALSRLCLGVHYRGTDKNLARHDTNPVSMDDMLALMEDFLVDHRQINSIFIATDEFALVQLARERFPRLRIHNLGSVPFHKDGGGGAGRADRALLDCVLLSRCAHVLKCSSALSGFAKVLNPDLDIYRVSACKLVHDIPYFPDAYVPRLAARTPRSQAILAKQFQGDWLDDPRAQAQFRQRFASMPRFGRWQTVKNGLKYLASRLLRRPLSA